MTPQLPLLSLPAPTPASKPESSGLTHLTPRAAAAKLAGFLHTDGARLQVGAESGARSGTRTEHLPRWTLWETHTARQHSCYRQPLLPTAWASRDGGLCTPGYSPGQPCRLHSCHCCVSRARHGAPSGRSSQLLWRTMVPPPQTAEHSLQDDQGPRTGHSRGGHTRDPLRHVLWTGCTPRTQAPSHDEQLSSPRSAQSLDLPHVTHPKPLAWFGRRAAYQLWQSSWTTCVGASSHEPLALGRPQWQEEMGTQCPSCTS